MKRPALSSALIILVVLLIGFACHAPKDSSLNYFRELTALRKSNLALVYGKYELLDKNNPKVYAYTRESDGEKLLIVLNFADTNSEIETRLNLSNAKMLLSNYQNVPARFEEKGHLMTRPYEAIIYKL